MIQLTLAKKPVSFDPFIPYNSNKLNDYQLMINRYCSIRENLANILTKNDALQNSNSFWMEIKSNDQKIKNYINQGIDKNLDFRKERFS